MPNTCPNRFSNFWLSLQRHKIWSPFWKLPVSSHLEGSAQSPHGVMNILVAAFVTPSHTRVVLVDVARPGGCPFSPSLFHVYPSWSVHSVEENDQCVDLQSRSWTGVCQSSVYDGQKISYNITRNMLLGWYCIFVVQSSIFYCFSFFYLLYDCYYLFLLKIN